MKKCTQSCREAVINVLFTERRTIYIEHWTSSSKILSNDQEAAQVDARGATGSKKYYLFMGKSILLYLERIL